MKSSLKGAVLASAVATLFSAGIATAGDKMVKTSGTAAVKCAGVNACAGKGGCKSVKNACAGKNACKGQSWVQEKSAKACTDQGGTVVVSKK